MALGWFDRKRQDSGEWTGFLEQGVRWKGASNPPERFASIAPPRALSFPRNPNPRRERQRRR